MECDVNEEKVSRMFPVESDVDKEHKEVHYNGTDPHDEIQDSEEVVH